MTGERVLTLAGGQDAVSSSVSYVLSAEVEDLVLTGTAALNGTGNAAANQISGNAAANVLAGLDGNDRLSGWDGNDTLDGGTGNDVLDGGAGTDSMIGGAGDDVYLVDTTTDLVVEAQDGGNDRVQSSVSYTLANQVEELVLTGSGAINGTGNSLDNLVVGNIGRNVLVGLDGNDTLSGAGGNDTLVGDAGNDVLDGGAGTDSMTGGAGDDTYIVDVATDVIVEAANGGKDTVQTGLTYILGTQLENLILTGTAAIDGTGNAADNVLVGNEGNNLLSGLAGNDGLFGGAGNDVLNGGLGDDWMEGGAGADRFVYTSGNDAVSGGAGNDLLDLSKYRADQVRFLQVGDSIRILTADGSVQLTDQARLAIGDPNGNIESILFADMTISDATIRSRAQTDATTYAPLPALALPNSTSAPSGSGGGASPQLSLARSADVSSAKSAAVQGFAASDQAFAFNSSQSSASAVANVQTHSFLSSFIAGDELNTVAEINAQSGHVIGGDAASGVLIDPAAAETAFLSATQLAALDHDRFTIV